MVLSQVAVADVDLRRKGVCFWATEVSSRVGRFGAVVAWVFGRKSAGDEAS